MDDIRSIRCPRCKWTFKILVGLDRLFVIDKSDITKEPQELKPPGPSRWPDHGGDQYAQGREILRKNAERNLKEQKMYPPNMPERSEEDE